MSTTQRLPYCEDTYADALGWSRVARDEKVEADCAYLREHSAVMSTANVQTIMREIRAVRYARVDSPR